MKKNYDEINTTKDNIMNASNDRSLFETSSNLFDNEKNNDKFEQIELKIVKDVVIHKDFIYGNWYSDKNPRKLGNTYTFYFNNRGEPLIVIGPHCILNKYNRRASICLLFVLLDLYFFFIFL